MPTNQQLKLALAKELPELISYSVSPGFPRIFAWKDTRKEITEREWDWVVREAVNKFHEPVENNVQKRHDYIYELGDSIDPHRHEFDTANATWQQRAIAYFKTIGKEII